VKKSLVNELHILPLATISRLIKKEAERVSDKATLAMQAILEEVISDVSKIAVELAAHANRKTIFDSDIKMAYKQWRKER
jgi:histone H3/H4